MHLTAKFVAEAQAALIKDLRTPDTAQFVPGLHRASTIANTVDEFSFNWAGYADTSSTAQEFTKVSGSWKVPAVTCTSEDRVTSEWVGLDGALASDPTVEQTGTSSQCFQDKAVYYAWYEMFPAGTVVITGVPVTAGQQITASVTRSGTSYTLALKNVTTAKSFSIVKTCALATCLDQSAEWITERPAFSNTGIIPEAQFKTDTFTAGSVTAGGKTTTISGYAGTNNNITCVDSTDTYNIVSTSGLTGGNSFTNTWDDSY